MPKKRLNNSKIERNDILFTKSNKKLKKKYINLIKGILKTDIKYVGDLKIEITNKSISIIYDENMIINKSIGDTPISINILKDIGCVISDGNLSTRFKDKNLYKKMIPESKISKDKINLLTFNYLNKEIIRKMNLSREIGLQNLEV
jgi:hypothetical protein